MQNNYIKHPRTVVQLAEEVKRACDDYWKRELAEVDLKELCYAWAQSGKLLRNKDLGSSIKKIIGKKRTNLVKKMLEGYQLNF